MATHPLLLFAQNIIGVPGIALNEQPNINIDNWEAGANSLFTESVRNGGTGYLVPPSFVKKHFFSDFSDSEPSCIYILLSHFTLISLHFSAFYTLYFRTI